MPANANRDQANPIVALSVPMTINKTTVKPADFTTKRRQIDSIYRNYLKPGKVNLDPVYQRRTAWSRVQKTDFIASCFNDMCIPALVYVKREVGKGGPNGTWLYDCIDGYQRQQTINEWYDNQFSIPVTMTYGNRPPQTERYTWAQMLELESVFTTLIDRFKEREIEVVTFEHMDVEACRKIFLALNAGSPLSVDEKIYCPNYMTRRLCDEVFKIVFGGLKEMMSTTIRSGYRYKNIRPAHEAILLACGPGLDEEFEVRSLQTSKVKESAEIVHEALKTAGLDFESEINDEVLDKLGIKRKVAKLAGYANAICEFLKAHPKVGLDGKGKEKNQSHHPRNLVDPLLFLFSLGNKFKAADIMARQADFKNWLVNYHRMRRQKSYDMTTTDLATMEGKFDIMQEMWAKYMPPLPQAA